MLTPLVISMWQKLSTRIVGLLLGYLFMALAVIGTTLLLSWELQGSAAAINVTGSLRMDSYRLGMLLVDRPATAVDGARQEQLRAQIKRLDDTLALLRRGDPQRPLLLPSGGAIRGGLDLAGAHWRGQLRPQVLATLAGRGPGTDRLEGDIDRFVGQLDVLVALIEQDAESSALWLRGSQLLLLALALLGTVGITYTLFNMIIAPVQRLQVAIERMRKQDFSVRLPVDSKDEFGRLAQDFNLMADRLHELYGNLEQLVETKTVALEGRNRELALLFESASFLQQAQSAESLCSGFLTRIRTFFHAEGGSVRVLDPTRGILHMMCHQGLSPELLAADHCLKVGDCLCGDAALKKISVVHDMRRMPETQRLTCQRAGFVTVSVFHIFAQSQHLGFFNLHFRQATTLNAGQTALLETLGQLLGTAIENQRLAEREREMAISEERNLVAQGLHDSIAQSLNYLNLQVQMLEQSLAQRQYDDVATIVPALRIGVEESYQDVRELLQNYRTRLQEGNFVQSLEVAVEKFRRQTGIDITLVADTDGAPFPREQQLQLLFIVQEALSNVRKHAAAQHVWVRLRDDHDFLLTIEDDGKGFVPALAGGEGDGHIGIHIMGERARRLEAVLTVDSAPGAGTRVELQLAGALRRAA
ncbi:type IV pili methyl-accepting chemotaxis transducer N-terminal domain-containing protein [Massilia sp. S19_KUP03_FR1]|uniref:type IV pili methyl-accepting chemotaxis transducer N-terminal domain-containing protein n=1 Tax=Massilia sp. S19_KUP03_FR1 TaxID=3025503 RepID=UPI002FCDBC2B